jgi:hypothetical protein
LATLVHTATDSKNRTKSVWFAGTELGRLVKEEFGTKVDSQTEDITTLFKVMAMEARGVERRLGTLVTSFGRKSEMTQDSNRRVMNPILEYDLCES